MAPNPPNAVTNTLKTRVLRKAYAMDVSMNVGVMPAEIGVAEHFAKEKTDNQEQESNGGDGKEDRESRETIQKGHKTNLPSQGLRFLGAVSV